MTCLHITIEKNEAERFVVKCDNMRREDAKPDEITFANKLEEGFAEALKAIASEIYRFEMNQSEPSK